MIINICNWHKNSHTTFHILLFSCNFRAELVGNIVCFNLFRLGSWIIGRKRNNWTDDCSCIKDLWNLLTHQYSWMRVKCLCFEWLQKYEARLLHILTLSVMQQLLTSGTHTSIVLFPPASHKFLWTSGTVITTWYLPWLKACWSTRRLSALTLSQTRTFSTSWTASTWAASPHACSWTSTVSIALCD